MTYNEAKRKGVIDKSFTFVKIAFRKDCLYERTKWIEGTTWQMGVAFLFAGGNGEEGQEEQLPWTLQTCINLSNQKYPLRARVYCVQVSG